MRMTKILAMVALVGAMALSATAAQADNLVWSIQSDHPNVVSLEFYSQDYDRAWPGGGDVYILDDWNPQSYNLQCSTGELICYGAWVRGDANTYWGVGIDNSQYCSDCCYYCGERTEPITLLP